MVYNFTIKMKYGALFMKVENTSNMIKESLLGLMREKELHSITVGELLKRAGVSRGTFYAHFGSLAEVRDALAADMFEAADAYMADIAPTDLIKVPYPFLLSAAEKLGGGRLSADGMGKYIGVSGLAEQLKPWLAKYLLDDKSFTESFDDEAKAEIYARYVSGGVIHTFNMWIKRDFSCDAEQLAHSLSELVLRSFAR